MDDNDLIFSGPNWNSRFFSLPHQSIRHGQSLIPVDVIFIIPQKIFNLISFLKYLDAKLETTCRKLWCGATPGEQTESMTVCRQRKQKVRWLSYSINKYYYHNITSFIPNVIIVFTCIFSIYKTNLIFTYNIGGENVFICDRVLWRVLAPVPCLLHLLLPQPMGEEFSRQTRF